MASTLSPSIPQEILDSLAAIKAVFASAKGPRVVQLQQDVAQIENYILSQEKTPATFAPPQDNVSVANQVEAIANKLAGITQENTLLQVVTASLQSNLNADRVIIYRFVTPEQGTAVAESVQPYCVSLLNQRLPYNSFQFESPTPQLKLLPSVYELTTSQLQFWRNFQVLSGLLMPLIVEEKLWGVIMVHYCREIPSISPNERNLLQQVGMMLTIALKPKLVLDNHQPAESDLENKIIPKTSPLIAFLKEINQRINLGIGNCENTLEKLIVLQKNNAVALQNLNLLKEEYQEAEQLINLIKKVRESLDILSVNTAIQATQQDSEEELVSIAEQVEIIASQAKETAANIEDWIIELQDTTNILDQSIKPTQTDLDTVVQSVEKMRQQLQEVVETTH